MPEPEHVVSSRAVYDHSADQYVEAVGTTVSPRFETALDRAVLDAFAEQVSAQETGTVVVDVGCGTGRVTSYLAERGLDIRGVDISSAMIEAALLAHPHLIFDVGTLTNVPVPDESMSGVVYWYSIIATPLAELRSAWAELDRILTRDGHLLVAFQTGENERVERADAYGSSTTLTLYQHGIDDVARSLEAAGFDVRARLLRKAELSHETTPQAFLFACRRPM